MKKIFTMTLMLIAANSYSAVEKSGQIKKVSIWGGIAKATVCGSNSSSCASFWVSLSDSKGQAVLSMWLTARLSQNSVYVQGYDPDKPEHPYSNASRFYGMHLN